MITIQKVSEALHLIETQVFQDLEINPFPQPINDLHDDITERYSSYMRDWFSNVASNDEFKKTTIELAASLTRLISELH